MVGFLNNMKKSIASSPRAIGGIVIVAAAAALMSGSAVQAEDGDGFSLSANAGVFSDYRFRGLSLSNRDTAIQGGLDLAHSGGFYVGTWGSSIESYGGSEVELDIYAGYGGEIGGLGTDIGILAYTYPGSDNTHYIEMYGSIAGGNDTFDWTLGAAYVWDQKNVGSQDNIYAYFDAGMPITDTPLSLAAHLGWEDGAFGNNKWDWTLGVSYDFQQFSLGLAYVDTNVSGNNTKAGIIASLSASF